MSTGQHPQRRRREYDVDAMQDEGTLRITLGGERWIAPEPDNDTLKQVLAVEAEWNARMDTEREAAKQHAPGSAEHVARQQREAEIGVDSLAPQLQLLVFRRGDNDEVLWDQPLTPDFIAEHRISARQQGLLLQEILGEGDARLRP